MDDWHGLIDFYEWPGIVRVTTMQTTFFCHFQTCPGIHPRAAGCTVNPDWCPTPQTADRCTCPWSPTRMTMKLPQVYSSLTMSTFAGDTLKGTPWNGKRAGGIRRRTENLLRAYDWRLAQFSQCPLGDQCRHRWSLEVLKAADDDSLMRGWLSFCVQECCQEGWLQRGLQEITCLVHFCATTMWHPRTAPAGSFKVQLCMTATHLHRLERSSSQQILQFKRETQLEERHKAQSRHGGRFTEGGVVWGSNVPWSVVKARLVWRSLSGVWVVHIIHLCCIAPAYFAGIFCTNIFSFL